MMSTVFYIVVIAAIALASYLLARRYVAVRGPRAVTCPADGSRAAVEANALRAVLRGPDPHQLSLKSCSHWPERSTCGQDCLRQIETAPDGCLVRNILSKWYADKSCVVCGKPLAGLDWTQHKPGLMAPDHVTTDWSQVRAQDLYGVLETHAPVCWNCHIATTFRRQYPELVTDRPWRR